MGDRWRIFLAQQWVRGEETKPALDCTAVCCMLYCKLYCVLYCVLLRVLCVLRTRPNTYRCSLSVFLRYKPHYVGPWVDTATQAPQVVILGTSHAEMYGSLLKRLAGILKDCALWEGTHELMR